MLKFRPNTICRQLHSSSLNQLFHDPFTSYLSRQINSFLSIQTPNVHSLLQSHAYIITTGHTDNLFISSKLISLYASLKKPTISRTIFDSIHYKDPFLWNSIIKTHFSNGLYSQAFEFYLSMRLSNTLPNQFTIPMVVSACAELGALDYGMIVHGFISRLGLFAGNSAVGSSFVYMYSKCGCMEDASLVFDEMPTRDVVAWTALVIGYVQNDESEKGLMGLCEMYNRSGDGERPNFRTLEGGFQACGDLGAVLEGRCLHGLVVKSGLGCSQVVKSSILSMYSKCEALEDAYLSFCEVPIQDLVSWTSIIGLYGKMGCATKCVGLFMEMLVSGVYPDTMVISCMLTAFADSMSLPEGKAFHGFIVRRNYDVDQDVHTALLSMYCKFGLLSFSENLFNGVNECNKEPWNLMVVGCGKVRNEVKCLKLFTKMNSLGIESNSNTLVWVISSCSRLGAFHLGLSLHCYVIKHLLHENISVSNSLIDMYGRVGNLAIAWRIFCRSKRDTVTWNTMISAYNHSGHSAEVFALFNQMVLEGFNPSSATLVIVLSACSHIASLEKGEQVHNYIKEQMFELNLALATALIDMYAKCGQIEKSREIFDMMKERDIISWNVMISGYGMHGDAKSAIDTFDQLERSNVRPNELTFLAVLSACTHAGLVKEGKSLFARMTDYSLIPTLKHYTCMVDLLGRSGNLCEAENLVLSMPIAPDGGLWGAVLSACKINNDPEMGIRIAKHAIESDPENDGYYIVISDLYNSIGMWEEAERMRNNMRERGVRKTAGWSAM